MINSLLALWLFERFELSLTAAGAFFFWTGLLSAVSQLAAAPLARRIGLVNTMVFTHLPANFCLIAAAFAPTLEIALALLLVRSLLSQMDVPARGAYVMSVVTPAERPAAASFTAVPRSLASSLSPSLTGAHVRRRRHGGAAGAVRRAEVRLRRRAARDVPQGAAPGLEKPPSAPGRRIHCRSKGENMIRNIALLIARSVHRRRAARAGARRPPEEDRRNQGDLDRLPDRRDAVLVHRRRQGAARASPSTCASAWSARSSAS